MGSYCCPVPDGFRSAYDIRVRFAETDAQGIAHHASYVVWLEVARVAYLADHAGGYRSIQAQGIEALTTGVQRRLPRRRRVRRRAHDPPALRRHPRRAVPLRVPDRARRRARGDGRDAPRDRRRRRRGSRRACRRGSWTRSLRLSGVVTVGSSSSSRPGRPSVVGRRRRRLARGRLLRLGGLLRRLLGADPDERRLADVERAPRVVVEELPVRVVDEALDARLRAAARRTRPTTRFPFSSVGSSVSLTGTGPGLDERRRSCSRRGGSRACRRG